MKRLHRYWISAILLIASMTSNAANGIIETKTYELCPGGSITLGIRQITVWSDTIMYDTLLVADPAQDSIYQYVVTVYPPFAKSESNRICIGDSIKWQDTVLYTAGVYERIYQSKHGCDSIYRFTLETYRPDTIDTTVVICPSTSFTWHGITAGMSGDYERMDTRPNGDLLYCRLHLTVKPLVHEEVLFTLCDDESVSFHGKTYVNAGEYYDQYTCDTLYKITVVKHPTQIYQQTGVMDATHPYYWQYQSDGQTITDTIRSPGMYEHTTHNPETGCNDIWRLVLTRNETKYHEIETVTICEDEDFSWRGLNHLNRQGVGQTTHYFDRYRTIADQDSIYELVLTVRPIERTLRTIPFCGSIIWNGTTYTESATIIDTLTSLQYGCDSIVTTVLSKGLTFHYHDTATLMPGETLIWHGKTITTGGQYEDSYISSFGCDSTYSLGVGLKPEGGQVKMRTERASICDGDVYPWRNKDYSTTGRYVDTVYVGSTQEIDSLIVLELAVHDNYAWTERFTFHEFPQNYRGQSIPSAGVYTFNYTTMYGCDSILTVYVDREIYQEEQVAVICPGKNYIWDYDGQAYNTTGVYTKTETDSQGRDSVQHILRLTVNYIPETHITKTICRGQSYTFGDQTYDKTGIYTYTFHDTGCDSTVILSLNVVSPDTIKYVHHMNEGDTYVWHSTTYREAGVAYYTTTNRFGCDSTEMLILTINHVDTIDTTAVICPGEVMKWHGIYASQSGHFTNAEQQPNRQFNFYRLHLTVRPLVQIDTAFTICGDESINWNGKTYDKGGYYTDYLGCDTAVTIHITQHPQQVYETNARLGSAGYSWTYRDADGNEQTETFTDPGTYEYESPNATTGCSEVWRLVLTKDETDYHFVETQTICEGDDFSWRGKDNLSGTPGTSHYYDKYETRAGKDSIYELVLTVIPYVRTVRTLTFCDEIEWKGTTYDAAAVVYDTIPLSTGCYEIQRINLDKATPFYSYETKDLPQGKVLNWHGIDIGSDGVYYDRQTTIHGCDSIYQITVTIIPATPETNQYSEELSICAGDTILWRGRELWRGGTYVDTVPQGAQYIDSIFTLSLTAWPSYKDTIIRHMYTCGNTASIRYQGKEYYKDTAVISNLATIHGCDSIVKVYLHFNTALFLSDTVEIPDTQLPYTWHYRLAGQTRDTVLTTSGTFYHEEQAEGGCVNHEEITLIAYPTFLFEQDTTICELDLPFHWLRGPIEHIGDELQHTIGTTKQYEYRYQSIHNTDSIYRLHLTIDEAPKATEQYYVCEGYSQWIRGKEYGKPGMTLDSLYRDTIRPHNAGSICDSIVYVEVYLSAIKQHTQVVVLHNGESIDWGRYHITTSGTYRDTVKNVAPYGCDSVSTLRVITEQSDERFICSNDTGLDVHPDKKYPYVWERPYPGAIPDTLYTSGTYRDTVFDKDGYIQDLYRMDLTVVNPYDTTILIHGCKNNGVVWRGYKYEQDTSFVERVEVIPHTHEQPCDSVFHVTIKIDTTYTYNIVDTICEHELPYILGRQDPKEIWAEDFYTHTDKTACGCDSVIYLTLRIIPSLTRTDSTFACEEEIQSNPVVLGNLVNPSFAAANGGQYTGEWQGKWKGISYHRDTIVYNCDSSYSHHIIVRPHQAHIPEYTYSLCKGDSVQLFLPYSDKWIYGPGIYEDTVTTVSSWQDPVHNTTIHNDRAYACDSITRWIVVAADTIHQDTTVHIAQGDSLFWNNRYLYATGSYDSIGEAMPHMDSAHHYCKYVMTLHLVVDPIYYYRDTLSVCDFPGKGILYTWADGYSREYTMPDKDSAYHEIYTLPTLLHRFDSVYDLYVDFHQKYFRIIRDTICYGDSIQFDQHHFESEHNVTKERYLKTPGTYVDTLQATNGCDSIIELRLVVRDRIDTVYSWASVVDRELPYEWKHTWSNGGQRIDSLYTSGVYRDTLPSVFGCDSVVGIYFTVRPTYLYRDTVDTCAPVNTTLTHKWADGFVRQYTTPKDKDTAIFTYRDTLVVSFPADSIFHELYVLFHRTYETHFYDTICAGDSAVIPTFNSASLPKRYYKQTGIYRDTVPSISGCDSVITLHLQVWPGFPTRYTEADINEKDTPYLWPHSYIEAGVLRRDTDSISIPGNYGRILKNIHGCDSIDSLTLRIHPNYIFHDTVTVCGYELPYTWTGPDGTIYKSDIYDSDTYTRQWRTQNGFGDSTRILHFTALPILYTLRTDTLCYGDSILFGKKDGKPRYISERGIYFDTLTSLVHGCDSVVELRLNVFDNYLNKYTRHIMRTELPYKWHHVKAASTDTIGFTELIAEGKFAYIFTTPFGCDSIDSLTLVVHDDYLYRDSVVICKDQVPYAWSGPDGTVYRDGIYNSGEYEYTLRRKDGYSDSVLIRKVTINPILYSQRYDTLCYGDSILFGLTKETKERYLKKPGVYYDTLRSIQYGCDSIIELTLNFFSHQDKYHSPVDITDADLPYTWYHVLANTTDTVDSTLINGFGEFEYVFTSVHGCDSTDHLTVNVHPNYYFRDTITICSDATPYTWSGPDGTVYKKDIYDSGEYTRHMRTADGFADSIYVRQINVLHVKNTVLRDSICEEDNNFFLFKGQQLTKGGVYRDTLTAESGCDSIVTLYLTVNKPYYNYIERHIVEGNTVKIMGQTFDKDTMFTVKGYTPSGCDSVTDIKVIMHPLVDTVVTVCSSSLPYQWVNKWTGQVTPLYAAGLYRNDTTYVNGQRMYYGLRLMVNKPVYTTIRDSICEGNGASYNFNGKQLTQTDIYRDTLPAANGCDSIVTLYLTVNKPYYNYIERHIVEGNTVKIMGQTFDKDTMFTVKGYTPSGCDSVTDVKVIMHPLVDTVVVVCASSLPYQWVNKWTGQVTPLYAAGLYRNDTTYVNGQRMYYGLRLIVTQPVYSTVQDTICEGDSYPFFGEELTEGGLYTKTTTTAYGCDSIVRLMLYVQPVRTFTEKKTILKGESVFFNGEERTESGTYLYRVPTANGKCFDTYQLVLTVIKPIVIDTAASVCENELPFIWRGYSFNEAGQYVLPVEPTDTTHITRTLNLTVNPVPRETRLRDICEGDVFVYKNKKYETNCIFNDTIPAHTGCDSIIQYIVRVHPTFDNVFERHISDKDTVNFHDRLGLNKEGTYEWTSKTQFGCDSAEHMTLYVHPSYFFFDSVEICEPDTLFWHGQKITQSGLYYDSLVTEQYGYKFDSVYHLRVKAYPYYLFHEKYEIGEGEIIKLHGRDISKPGEYWDTLYTTHGCDSIFHVVVNKKHTLEFTRTLELCQNETPYKWYDKTLTRSGNYTYTSRYKDSIVHLQLTVYPISISEQRAVITDKQRPYLYGGKLYEDLPEEGTKVYHDTLTNQYGCDSIVRLAIVVTKRYSEWTPIPLCPGSELKIDGQVITEAGLYSFVRRSRETGEMDSLFRVEVYNAAAYDLPTEHRVICDGDTVFMGDRAITRAGHYDFALKTADGCDSLLHLDLTVNPSYHFYQYATTQDYEAYAWLGKSYTQTGIYDRTWATIKDCDSTYTLDLTVIETLRDTLTETICVGQSYNWRNKQYSVDGYYTDTVWEPEARFSAIYALRLIVAHPTTITTARTGEICADSEDFDIYFQYSGQKPTHYSVYFNQLAKREGFEDVINQPFGADMIAHVPLPKFNKIAYQGHPYYVRPDYYTMRIALDNGVCGISRSDSLTLLVKYPSWIIEQNWQDIVVPLKAEYNGGFEFAQIDWYVNGVQTVGGGSGYLQSNDLQIGDQVVMMATRKGETIAIPTCPLIIQKPGVPTYDTPVIVYPTQTPKQMPVITVEAPQKGEYEIFSSTGLLIGSGRLEEGKTTLTLPAINGIYFIRTHQGREVESHKVILY